MSYSKLNDAVRELGYQLAERELHELFGKVYWAKKREHDRLLNKLYSKEKRI